MSEADKSAPLMPNIDGFSDLEMTKIRVIAKYLRIGMDMQSACYMAGLSPSTMNNWIREGNNKPDSRYAALLMKLRQVVGNLEGAILGELNFTHIHGRKAEYESRLAKETIDKDGNIVRDYIQVKVKEEIKPDPKAAQWLLGRRFRQKWGDSIDINLTKDLLESSARTEKVVDRPRSTREELELIKHYAEQLEVIAEMEDEKTAESNLPDVIDVENENTED
jgi:hypothetical protein